MTSDILWANVAPDKDNPARTYQNLALGSISSSSQRPSRQCPWPGPLAFLKLGMFNHAPGEEQQPLPEYSRKAVQAGPQRHRCSVCPGRRGLAMSRQRAHLPLSPDPAPCHLQLLKVPKHLLS